MSDANEIERALGHFRELGWEDGLRAWAREAPPGACEPLARASRSLDENNAAVAAALAVCESLPGLEGWARLALAELGWRYDNLDDRSVKLETDEALDGVLAGAAAHLRGTALFHRDDLDASLAALNEAMRLLGPGHYLSGRVLDTLGMFYAVRSNFIAAEQLYLRAAAHKEQRDDTAGLAYTYGGLGRLYLDWGDPDNAERYFRLDYRISERIGDERAQAQMLNHLGRVGLFRAEQSGEARQLGDADGWLTAAAALAERRDYGRLRGYTCKDLALVRLAQKRPDEAADQLTEAERRFRTGERPFRAGLALVNRAWGALHRERRQWAEALQRLRKARNYFANAKEPPEVALTLLEMARTQRDAGEPPVVVADRYLEALLEAEGCRRPWLLARIERELACLAPERHREHLYRRARGRGVGEDTTSLVTGVAEAASVLYFDLLGSTASTAGGTARAMLLTFNQLMDDLARALRRYGAVISGYRGDGFLALFRGDWHARRAVEAGLALFRELDEFNHPRRVLGQPPLEARVGVATGEVVLGNVGTCDKLDFTALGTAANLGARIESKAVAGRPCISRQTHDDVGARFRYGDDSPRRLDLRGLGEQLAWDVLGPADESSAGGLA